MMRSKNSRGSFVTGLNTIFTWITKISWLNLLWMGYTLVGFIIGGIFPATIAAVKISQQWLEEGKSPNSWRSFHQFYKKEWFRANSLGWLLSLLGLLLWLNYKVMVNRLGDLHAIHIFSFYFLIILYVSTAIWIFPIMTQHEKGMLSVMKESFILALGKIHITILALLWVGGIGYLSLTFPAMLLFFTGSLIIFGLVKITHPTIQDIQND